MSSNITSIFKNQEKFKTQVETFLASSQQLREAESYRIYRSRLRNFRNWWLEKGEPNLTVEVCLNWFLDEVHRTSVTTTQAHVFALKEFLDHSVQVGLLNENSLRDVPKGYSSLGYTGIIRELERTGSVGTVMAQADHPFSGPLGPSCLAYLEHLMALGKGIRAQRYCLVSFERFLRSQNVSNWGEATVDLICKWLKTRNLSSDFLPLKKFFEYLIYQGKIEVSPVPASGHQRRKSLSPRIFSINEVKAILDEAAKLPDHRFLPFRGASYRMLFLSLYTLGLRISEALNLQLGDIDFTQHCITIGQTKFHKGRVLPFGPRYEVALQVYIDKHPMLINSGRTAFIFPSDYSRAAHLGSATARGILQQIVSGLGITTPAGIRRPNLHSFRHSFAVHRLEQWLREGANLEVKLPLLSAFLGHIDDHGTQVYLTMTPERLTLIGERFENAVGRGVSK